MLKHRKLVAAAELVLEGRCMPVEGFLLGAEGADTLVVTGWSRSSTVDGITKESALMELRRVKATYEEMTAVCPDLLELSGKSRVRFRLGFDYGKGALHICSELDGDLTWEHQSLASTER